MPDEPDAETTRAIFHVVDDELFATESQIRSMIEMWVDSALAFGLTGLIEVDRTAGRLAASFRPARIGWDRFESLTEAEAAYRERPPGSISSRAASHSTSTPQAM